MKRLWIVMGLAALAACGGCRLFDDDDDQPPAPVYYYYPQPQAYCYPVQPTPQACTPCQPLAPSAPNSPYGPPRTNPPPR